MLYFRNIDGDAREIFQHTFIHRHGGEEMEVIYRSTRSNSEPVTASQAILKGLSDDGGLFVPDHIPALDKSLSELAGMSYQQVAYEVMKLFLTDFTEEELKIVSTTLMIPSLIRRRSLLWYRRMMLIIWNCSMVPPLRSRIWHFPFYLT